MSALEELRFATGTTVLGGSLAHRLTGFVQSIKSQVLCVLVVSEGTHSLCFEEPRK